MDGVVVGPIIGSLSENTAAGGTENDWYKAAWRRHSSDGAAVCLFAGVGLALTALVAALGYGADLAQAFAVLG